MKREGDQQDGDGWVMVCDPDDGGLFEIWTCRFCWNKIFPNPVCMGQKLSNVLPIREHAPNRYISFITASIYWRTEYPCVIRRDRPNQKNPRNMNFELMTHRIESVSPDDAGVIIPSIYIRGDAFHVNRKIHRNSCAWLGDTDRHSVRLPYLLQNRLVFSPYRPEKELYL
jgi:hypothetical protein